MGPRLRETNLHAASSDDVKRSGHGNPAYTIDAYQHVLPRMQAKLPASSGRVGRARCRLPTYAAVGDAGAV